MTTENYFVIKNGPSKYDLVMSLFEKKMVKFEKESQDRLISVSRAVITGLQEDIADSNSYILQLFIKSDSDDKINENEFYFAYYNSSVRRGVMKHRLDDLSGFKNFFFNFNLELSGTYVLDPVYKSELPELFGKKNHDWIADGVAENINFDLLNKLYRAESYISYLFDFRYSVGPKKIVKKMLENKLSPANFLDLLIFSKRFPEKQKQLPILALGSTCLNDKKEECYLCLSFDELSCLDISHAGRQLCLVPVQDIFLSGDYYYLAVTPEEQ